jgi:hypothetical protein
VCSTIFHSCYWILDNRTYYLIVPCHFEDYSPLTDTLTFCSLKIIYIIFKNSYRTSQKTYRVYITKTNRLMLFLGISVLFPENRMAHITIFCGQSSELLQSFNCWRMQLPLSSKSSILFTSKPASTFASCNWKLLTILQNIRRHKNIVTELKREPLLGYGIVNNS